MYIKQKNPHGGDIYFRNIVLDISSNINPAGMPEKVKQAIRDAADDCERYPDAYCRQLRKSISAAEEVPEDCIICGNGAAEMIYAYAYSLGTERPALIVSPTFSDYQDALESAGVETEHYLLKKEDGLRLTDDILERDLCSYGAVFICTPNNPTGIAVKPELLRRIADTGARLFVDMCFLDLTDQPDRYGIPDLLVQYPGVTVLRAFTKSYAMAGVRLGYAMSSDSELLERMSSKTQCWNVSSIAQQAGIAALECADWLKESVREISRERKRLTEELQSLGVEVWPGEANYLLLRTDIDLYEEMLRRRILVRDCSNYRALDKGFYRIAVRNEEENDLFLNAIKEVLK